MPLQKTPICLRMFTLLLLCGLLAACGGRAAKPDELLKSSDIPTTFDLVLLADKDGLLDLDGATVSAEDLRGHVRYLAETGHPVKTALLKPGVKEKIKPPHRGALVKVGYEMKFRTFVEQDGQIAELRTQAVPNQ